MSRQLSLRRDRWEGGLRLLESASGAYGTQSKGGRRRNLTSGRICHPTLSTRDGKLSAMDANTLKGLISSDANALEPQLGLGVERMLLRCPVDSPHAQKTYWLLFGGG